MKKSKALMLASSILILSLLLTGCFTTRNAIIFDGDWQAYVGMDIITDDFGPSEEELNDIVARIRLFFPEMQQISSEKKMIRYVSNRQLNLDELGFIKKEPLEDGTTKLTIDLPSLISAKNWEGEPKGAPMIFELYVPGQVLEANTLDFQNDYVMESVFAGEKRARIIWQLRKDQLTSPLRLWAIIQE